MLSPCFPPAFNTHSIRFPLPWRRPLFLHSTLCLLPFPRFPRASRSDLDSRFKVQGSRFRFRARSPPSSTLHPRPHAHRPTNPIIHQSINPLPACQPCPCRNHPGRTRAKPQRCIGDGSEVYRKCIGGVSDQHGLTPDLPHTFPLRTTSIQPPPGTSRASPQRPGFKVPPPIPVNHQLSSSAPPAKPHQIPCPDRDQRRGASVLQSRQPRGRSPLGFRHSLDTRHSSSRAPLPSIHDSINAKAPGGKDARGSL